MIKKLLIFLYVIFLGPLISFHSIIRSRFKKNITCNKPNPNILDSKTQGFLLKQQFCRYEMYLDMAEFVKKEFSSKQMNNSRIIEFGGSNGMVRQIFNHPNYEIAENYPRVDIQDLKDFESDYYSFIILDQVLEHVANPWRAIKEVYRLLKKGGWLIVGTPFLVQIHKSPEDYWRFTKDGLAELLQGFSEKHIKSWGNKEIAVFHILLGSWPNARCIRKLTPFLFNLPNEEDYPYVIWAYAKK